MIDLTKAPEGATHYMADGIGDICWYIIGDGEHKYLYGCDVGRCEWRYGDYPSPVYDVKPIGKQKTERELFIDAAMAHYDHDTVDSHTIAMLGSMFNAGFKAPKVGE